MSSCVLSVCLSSIRGDASGWTQLPFIDPVTRPTSFDSSAFFGRAAIDSPRTLHPKSGVAEFIGYSSFRHDMYMNDKAKTTNGSLQEGFQPIPQFLPSPVTPIIPLSCV